MPGLYDLRGLQITDCRVGAGWSEWSNKVFNWVGSVLHRSRTTYHTDRRYVLLRVWSICSTAAVDHDLSDGCGLFIHKVGGWRDRGKRQTEYDFCSQTAWKRDAAPYIPREKLRKCLNRIVITGEPVTATVLDRERAGGKRGKKGDVKPLVGRPYLNREESPVFRPTNAFFLFIDRLIVCPNASSKAEEAPWCARTRVPGLEYC